MQRPWVRAINIHKEARGKAHKEQEKEGQVYSGKGREAKEKRIHAKKVFKGKARKEQKETCTKLLPLLIMQMIYEKYQKCYSLRFEKRWVCKNYLAYLTCVSRLCP